MAYLITDGGGGVSKPVVKPVLTTTTTSQSGQSTIASTAEAVRQRQEDWLKNLTKPKQTWRNPDTGMWETIEIDPNSKPWLVTRPWTKERQEERDELIRGLLEGLISIASIGAAAAKSFGGPEASAIGRFGTSIISETKYYARKQYKSSSKRTYGQSGSNYKQYKHGSGASGRNRKRTR